MELWKILILIWIGALGVVMASENLAKEVQASEGQAEEAIANEGPAKEAISTEAQAEQVIEKIKEVVANEVEASQEGVECQSGYCKKSCSWSPDSLEGPFFVKGQPERSDVTEGKEGVPLRLELTIKDFDRNCSPVEDAEVHIWHPDASGVYSAYLDYYPLGHEGSKEITGEHAEPSDNSTFLRGIQKTNAEGKVTFNTIFPGWYLNRAAHIHVKVFANGKDCHTGEIFFPDEVTNQVALVKPYVDSQGDRRNPNAEDWLFVRYHGFETIANVTGDVKTGLKAERNFIVSLAGYAWKFF